MSIEYRDADYQIVARMPHVNGGRDAGVLIAQKYLAQFPAIASAHVMTGGTETVVSRATEWQKRNG